MQTPCESDPGALIAPYERARRDAVRLWRAKWQLWKAGQEKFFKTSREFQSIDRLCWSDPTCQIRALADASACRFADIHGDAPFHKTVDGAELLSPTMWVAGPRLEQDQAIQSERAIAALGLAVDCEGVHTQRCRAASRGYKASLGRIQEVERQTRESHRLDRWVLARMPGLSLAHPRSKHAIFRGQRDRRILGRLTEGVRAAGACSNMFAPARNMQPWKGRTRP